MVNTKMFEFKHPKYYKELRKLRNKLDQVISKESSTEENQRAPGSGPKRQALEETVPYNDIEEAQASSGKPQAASLEKQDSSPEEQASSRKP